jgi:hypothetical protein
MTMTKKLQYYKGAAKNLIPLPTLRLPPCSRKIEHTEAPTDTSLKLCKGRGNNDFLLVDNDLL